MHHSIKKNNKIKSPIFFTPIIFLLFIMCITTGRAMWNIYQKAQQAKKNIMVTTEEYNKLKNREQELETKINLLKTSLGVEAEIRDKFGFAKKGEEIVVVIDNSEPVKEIQQDHVVKKNFWGKIKEWLW